MLYVVIISFTISIFTIKYFTYKTKEIKYINSSDRKLKTTIIREQK